MKTLIALTLPFALCANLGASGPLAYTDSRSLPAEAEGLVAISRILTGDKPRLSTCVIATVSNVATAEARDIPPRKWLNEFTNTSMIDFPSRVTFELTASPLGQTYESGPLAVIDWTSDLADNWTDSGKRAGFGHKFNHHRDAVMAKPLVDTTVICFTPPLVNQDGSITKSLDLLPKDSLDALAAALAWRGERAALFAPKETITDEAIKSLRGELSNSNVYARLSVLLHLITLGKAGAADVAAVFKAAKAPVESAATTVMIITDAPDLVPSILDALGDPLANRSMLDGVAVGAAAHFLNLAESERMLSAARSFQIVRANSPTIPDKLKATISYPLLLKLGDAVTGKDGKTMIEVSSALFKFLKASAALRR